MSCQDVVTCFRQLTFKKENKSYTIMCTFKILKCPIENTCDLQENSCSWFQDAELKEACSLLIPNLKEMVPVTNRLSAQQKNANKNILTGKSVKLAYRIVDNLNNERVLTSTDNNDKSHGGSFKAHHSSRMQVFVSVTKSGNQKDVKCSTDVLSQPCNSRYFERQDTPKEIVHEDSGNNQPSEEQPVKLKEARVILQKIVSVGHLKEKDRATKKSKLRMRKKCLKSDVKNDENDGQPTCSQPKSPKTDDKVTRKDESYSQVQHVKDLSLKQLEDFFDRNAAYLSAIYRGEADCSRHTKYASGSARQRRELDFQVNLSFYHEEQVDQAIALLKKLMAPDGDTKVDYILRVLLPEFLIKVYMDLKGVDQELAELKMKPCSETRNPDSPVRYT